MLKEMLRLRRMTGKLSPSEYLDFRLYETDLTFEEKSCFLGYRGQAELEEILVDDYSKILSLDKLTFYQLMRGYGIPVPELFAVYAESERPFQGRHLRSRKELEEYLSGEASYPLYMKRSFGAYGRNNTMACGCEAGDLIFGDGRRTSVHDFCESLADAGHFGWLLQESLECHRDIARICGSRISGLRIHPFLLDDRVNIHRVIWKINVGKLDSDNFAHGTSGNLLANVDIATGIVTRVVSGVGCEQQEMEFHPSTGERLIGFKVPWFDEAIDLVRRATTIFPGFVCPGWDIALCERGPVALEVNAFGDVDLSQHSLRRGFLDVHLMEMMRSRGLDTLLDDKPRRSYQCATGRRGWRRSHWRY